MKKLFGLIVLLLMGFYIVWPAYTGYAIHTALEAEDSDVLSRKIDFPQVRASIRQPVMDMLDRRLGELVTDFGSTFGISKDKIKMDRIDAIVTSSLEDVVSPDRIGAIYKSGGDITGEVRRSVLRQIDNAGGLMEFIDTSDLDQNQADTGDASGGLDLSNGIGGLLKNKNARRILGDVAKSLGGSGGLSADALFPKKSRTIATGNGERSFDFSNVKHFGFAGPLAMELGVAADRDAVDPDVTARMSFQNFDWKVTQLVPNL